MAEPEAARRGPVREDDLEALFSTRESELPQLLSPFPRALDSIFTIAFFRANELLNLYTDARVLEILAALGVGAGDVVPDDPGELSAEGLDPTRADAVRWLLAKAAGSALVEPGTDGRPRVRVLPPRFVEAVRAAALDEDERLAASVELVDLAAEGYLEYLRGEKRGADILFAPSTLPLWGRYFSNDNPLYHPTNYIAACGARDALVEADSVGPVERRLRVLEVGAGCGSAAECLLREIGPHVAEYVATDISPHFLRVARQRIEALEGVDGIRLELRGLDLDRPADTWRIDPGSFDVVFGVNVLHAVRDLGPALRGLRSALAPGGALVLGECVRPQRGRAVHPELVFQLLDEFRAARLVEPWRPTWGFLDAASWRGALEAAGFGEVWTLPDFDACVAGYGEYCVAAIVAREAPRADP